MDGPNKSGRDELLGGAGRVAGCRLHSRFHPPLIHISIHSFLAPAYCRALRAPLSSRPSGNKYQWSVASWRTAIRLRIRAESHGTSSGHGNKYHRRAGGVARDQLRSIVERIERLEEEKAALANDIKEVYAEAKGNGFDTKTLRQVIRMRKQDKAERQEQEAILELYMSALGMI